MTCSDGFHLVEFDDDDDDFTKKLNHSAKLMERDDMMKASAKSISYEKKVLYDVTRIHHRRRLAYYFRDNYNYGPSYEEKTLVWPDRTFSLRAKSSGIVWAAVHGTRSICVVTRTGDLDRARALDYLSDHAVESVLPDFRLSVISELEDLARPYSQLSKFFGHRVPKPFGAVCVNLGSDRVHEESDYEASSAEFDVTAATKFLKEEMEGSTVDETIKSAISAFQNLFQNKKLKAEEIEVSVMDPHYFRKRDKNVMDIDTSLKHLAMSDIEDYLAAINKPISRNSWSVGKNRDSRRWEARVKKEIEKYQASNPQITEPFADLKRKLSTMSIPDIGDFRWKDRIIAWEARVKKEIEKYQPSNPKITEPFADLKRKLSTMSIPDIGDYSRNKKEEEDHMAAVDPKSRAVGGTETPVHHE